MVKVSFAVKNHNIWKITFYREMKKRVNCKSQCIYKIVYNYIYLEISFHVPYIDSLEYDVPSVIIIIVEPLITLVNSLIFPAADTSSQLKLQCFSTYIFSLQFFIHNNN